MNMLVSSIATITATDVSVALEESCCPVYTHTHIHLSIYVHLILFI